MAVGDINPQVATSVASFTRPADTNAYASGDLVSNSVASGAACVPLQISTSDGGGKGTIHAVRLRKNGVGIINAAFRVHIYNKSPVVANADNGVFSSDSFSSYLGAFDVTAMQAFTDGAMGRGFSTPGQSTLYAYIEALGAYTPASAEVFTLMLEASASGT
jgi:hypothetical protein